MKKYGKIIEYDGNIGKIIDNDGNIYIFTKKDLNKDVILNDFVMFKEELFVTPDINERIARFITKINS